MRQPSTFPRQFAPLAAIRYEQSKTQSEAIWPKSKPGAPFWRGQPLRSRRGPKVESSACHPRHLPSLLMHPLEATEESLPSTEPPLLDEPWQSTDWQRLWLALARKRWRTLALVPGGSGAEPELTIDVAVALA